MKNYSTREFFKRVFISLAEMEINRPNKWLSDTTGIPEQYIASLKKGAKTEKHELRVNNVIRICIALNKSPEQLLFGGEKNFNFNEKYDIEKIITKMWERIIKIMHEKKLNFSKFASQYGYSASGLSTKVQSFRQNKKISDTQLSVLIDLSQELNVSLDYLIFGI